METPTMPGRERRSSDAEARRAAASMMGRARTERKVAATRANVAKINERRQREGFPEETREKLRVAQAVRRERERAERAALGHAAVPAEKKKPGRPKTRPERPDGEKRPIGRPKKQAVSAMTPNSAEESV